MYNIYEHWLQVYNSSLDLQDIQVWQNEDFVKVFDHLTTVYLLTENNYNKFYELVETLNAMFMKSSLLGTLQLSEASRRQVLSIVQIFNTSILPVFLEIGLTQTQQKGYPFISTFQLLNNILRTVSKTDNKILKDEVLKQLCKKALFQKFKDLAKTLSIEDKFLVGIINFSIECVKFGCKIPELFEFCKYCLDDLFYLTLDSNFKEAWQIETFLNLSYTSSLMFGLDVKNSGNTRDDILTDMNVNLTFKATTFALIINFTESRTTYFRILAWNTIYNVLNYHTLNYY